MVDDRPVCSEELIEAALRQTLQRVARRVEWRLEDGTLLLRGQVVSFHQKQLAQTAARRLPGIDRIVNELEVEHGNARRSNSRPDED